MRKRSLLPILSAFVISSCMVEKGEVNIKLPGAKNFRNSEITKATVTNVQIINDQLVITGSNLNVVTNIKTENASKSFSESFTIESKSNSQIIANSKSPLSFAVNSLFNLVLSNSYGAATFQINFSLCDATINGKGINCSVVANDKDVLSYDSVSDTWKPRQVNGLNYLGTFDASPGIAPTAQPSGSYYVISVSGTIGAINFDVGDWIVSNGAAYQKIDNSTAIISVFGRTGAVSGLEGDYSLDLLSDVDLLTTPPTAGKILKYNGTQWVVSDDLSSGGAGSVSSSEIADGSIATADLANASVTDAKISSIAASKITGTVNGSQIGAGIITNSHIAAGAAIDYSKLNITNGTIPYAHVNVGAGEIAQDRIAGFSTALSNLLTGTITNGDTTHAPTGDAVFDALGLKLNLTGGTLSVGTINGVPTPVNGDDIVNKAYVDSAVTGATTTANDKVSKTGDTMTGALVLPSNGLTVGTNQLTVSGGNVGIGTATPLKNLHAQDGIMAGSNSGFPTDYNGVENEFNVGFLKKWTETSGNQVNTGAYSFVAPPTNSTKASNSLVSILFLDLPTGVTSSGMNRGIYSMALRNRYTGNNDNGTASAIVGIQNEYGHQNQTVGSTPTTTNVYGTIYSPAAMSGTITNLYDIYISPPLTGGSIGNHFSIYQESSAAKNYFAGDVGIGTTTPSQKLDVVGNINATQLCIAGDCKSSWPTGLASNSVTSAEITDGSIMNADINAAANIAQSKIAGLTTDLSNKQPLDTGLTNLAAFNTNGILVQSADNTFVGRSIAGTANRLDVTNGDGASGNPTLNISPTLLPSPTVGGYFLKSTGADASAWSALTSGEITTALGFTPVNKSGDTISTGTITFNAIGTLSLGYTPTNLTDATSKSYVDNLVATGVNQWTESSGNVYRSTGNVGIGTASPGHKLQVNGRIATGVAGTMQGGISIFPNNAGSWFHIDNKNDNTMRISAGNNPSDADIMSLNSNGNVGIGTVAPSAKLEVKDTNSTSTVLYVGDSNTNGSTGLYFNRWAAGTNPMGIQGTIAGVGAGDITLQAQGGNVGIGTTSPLYKLQINKSSTASPALMIGGGFSGGPRIQTYGLDADPLGRMGLGTDMSGETYDHSIYTSAPAQNGKITFGQYDGTTYTERMRIHGNGNVGIGTVSPTNPLNINSSVANVVKIESSHINHTNLQLYNTSNSKGWNFLTVGSTPTAYGGNGAFTIDEIGGGARFTIESGGNIGIGTTTPGEKLEVNGGNLQVRSGTTMTSPGNPGGLRLYNTQSTGGSDYLNIGWTGENTYSIQSADETTYRTLSLNPYGGLVGIGTTSPNFRLDVKDTMGLSSNTYPGFYLVNDSKTGANVARRWVMYNMSSPGYSDAMEFWVYDTTGCPGGLCQANFKLYDDGNAWLRGTLTQASDQRLKKNIVPINSSLERILSLDGVYYNWISEAMDKDRQIGLIAQDVQKVFPEAVKKNADGFLSVSYANLIAPVIESIKELYHKVMGHDKAIEENQRAIASLKVQTDSEIKKKDLEIRKLKAQNDMMKNYLCQKDPKAPFCQH